MIQLKFSVFISMFGEVEIVSLVEKFVREIKNITPNMFVRNFMQFGIIGDTTKVGIIKESSFRI